MRILEWIARGGWVMYPLLACSLLVVTICLERMIALGWFDRRFRRRAAILRDQLLREHGWCARSEQVNAPSAVWVLLGAAQSVWNESPARLHEALTCAAHEAARQLEARRHAALIQSAKDKNEDANCQEDCQKNRFRKRYLMPRIGELRDVPEKVALKREQTCGEHGHNHQQRILEA